MAKQAPKDKKKRKASTTLLWGLLGLVILVGGAFSALYYMNQERIQTDTRLKVIKDFVAKLDQTLEQGKSTLDVTLEKGKSVAGMAREKVTGMSPAMPSFGGRSYRVKRNDTLWRIAQESNLVDNPWEWRTILLENSDKIEYAFISDEAIAREIDAEESRWKVMMAEGQELTVSRRASDPTEPAEGKKYAVQLASMGEAQYRRAVFVVRVMMKDGYYAYLYPHEQGGATYYRIRSGFYDSEARATAIGEELKARYEKQNYFPDKLWVLQPSPGELRGEELAFGAQLVNPWVVELAARHTHAEALADLHKITGTGKFAYIWQTRNPDSKRFVYRVRVGFFPSEAKAKALYEGRDAAVWKEAQPAKVEQFEETLPGQIHKLGEPAS
jgi:cell division septation protein DedD